MEPLACAIRKGSALTDELTIGLVQRLFAAASWQTHAGVSCFRRDSCFVQVGLSETETELVLGLEIDRRRLGENSPRFLSARVPKGRVIRPLEPVATRWFETRLANFQPIPSAR
jgi:hypothetical protein